MKILVEIYGGTNHRCTYGCFFCDSQVACGDSKPTNKQLEHFIKELHGSCGNKLEVRYIDTDKRGLKTLPVISKAVKAGYLFPIIVIDGKPILAGTMSVDKIKRILQGKRLLYEEIS